MEKTICMIAKIEKRIYLLLIIYIKSIFLNKRISFKYNNMMLLCNTISPWIQKRHKKEFDREKLKEI